MNHEAGHFAGSDHDHTSDQFMMNAFMLQHHQHHDQLTGGVGSYHISCNYPATAAAVAPCSAAAPPNFQLDHHPFGAHIGSVSGALGSSPAGAFPTIGGGHMGALAGAIPAGSSQSSSGMLTYGGAIPARIMSAPGNGMPQSQSGGTSGSGCGSSVPGRTGTVANSAGGSPAPPSRYESQKRRDWNTFGHYLKNNSPPLLVTRCNGDHVLQFLRYLDQFGKTKVHAQRCPYFGLPHPPGPCDCPFRQAWGSLDALIGRLRAAFEEHGGKPESNPFGARQVRLYLREVRELQAKARGIAYEKKKRKRPKPQAATGTNCASSTDSNTNFHPEPPAGSCSSSVFAISGCN